MQQSTLTKSDVGSLSTKTESQKLNEIRKKLNAETEKEVNTNKALIVGRTAICLNFGLWQTALLPLLNGENLNRKLVETTFGSLVREVLKELNFFDIKEEQLEKFCEGIDKEEEPVPFDKPEVFFAENIFAFRSFLATDINNTQYLAFLKGVSLFLEIDFNNSLLQALKN